MIPNSISKPDPSYAHSPRLPIPERGYAFGRSFLAVYHYIFLFSFFLISLVVFLETFGVGNGKPLTADSESLFYWIGRVFGLLFFAVLFFQATILATAWHSIQSLRYENLSESKMLTPVPAVGFLLVPFFNFVWLFITYRGVAKRINKMLRVRGCKETISLPTITSACCLLLLPFAWLLFAWLYIVFFPHTAHNTSKLSGKLFLYFFFFISCSAYIFFYWMHHLLANITNRLCFHLRQTGNAETVALDNNPAKDNLLGKIVCLTCVALLLSAMTLLVLAV